MKRNGVFLLVLLASSVLLCSFGLIDAKAQADIVPPDSPIATPVPLAPSAEVALKYVADLHGVSTDDLTVSAGEVIVFPVLGLRYDYYVVAPKWAGKVPIVSLLVDPATGAIETDVNAIQQKEDEAYAVKYGKLHPTLWERLQTTAADELLPVALWVAQDEKAKSPESLEAEVAAQFPEAGEALAQNGVAWAVEDPELEIKIFRAYVDLINAETARRVQPVREWLEQKDYKVYEAPGIPLLTATLAAADIEGLAKLPQVAQIYLIEAVGQPEADIAVATDRVPAVWRQGYTGVGIKLAILEPGRINTGSLPELGSRFVGSVHVAANLPVAVAAMQYKGDSQLMALSSSQPLGASLYAPLIQNNNSGWLSGLGLRLPDGAMPFTVQYFTTASIACAIENWWNNPQTVYPAPQGNPPSCGTTPSAIIKSASGAMAASVNQLQGSLNATTYEAIAVPSMAVSVPKVQRGSGWNDGFVILNTSDAWINITVRLYNLDGSLYSTPISNQSLGPRWSLTVLGQIPDPFNGSAQISANGNVAVIANAFHPGANSGDVIGSQPGIHR